MLAAVWLAAACRSGPAAPPAPPPVPPDTWAVVDGRVISRGDVDKAFRRMQDPSQSPSEEEVLAAKLNLLNDLIVQDLLLAKAQCVEGRDSGGDIDKAFNDAKNNMPEAAFQEELKRRNITADDMREGLRRQLVTQKVIEQEVTSKVASATSRSPTSSTPTRRSSTSRKRRITSRRSSSRRSAKSGSATAPATMPRRRKRRWRRRAC